MTTTADMIVAYAREQLGKPYVWGATGPNSFDCSGLVYAAYKAAGFPGFGKPMPRLTAAQFGQTGRAVSLQDAKPGDIVYFNEPGSVDHVGILTDNVGGGHMIDAPTAGKPVEQVPIGHPTSIREWPSIDGTAVTTQVGNAVSDAVSGIAAGWQTDATKIALYVVAAASAAGLVIVGAMHTVN